MLRITCTLAYSDGTATGASCEPVPRPGTTRGRCRRGLWRLPSSRSRSTCTGCSSGTSRSETRQRTFLACSWGGTHETCSNFEARYVGGSRGGWCRRRFRTSPETETSRQARSWRRRRYSRGSVLCCRLLLQRSAGGIQEREALWCLCSLAESTRERCCRGAFRLRPSTETKLRAQRLGARPRARPK